MTEMVYQLGCNSSAVHGQKLLCCKWRLLLRFVHFLYFTHEVRILSPFLTQIAPGKYEQRSLSVNIPRCQSFEVTRGEIKTNFANALNCDDHRESVLHFDDNQRCCTTSSYNTEIRTPFNCH